MKNLNWKKTVGLGVLLWVLMFAIVSVLILLKIYIPGEANVLVVFIAAAVSYVLAGYAKPKDQKEALTFGLSWVVVGILLDALVTMRFSADIFQMWTLWLGYALVLLAPLLKVKK